MHRVPERIKNRRHVPLDVLFVVPDVGHRHRYVLRKRTRTIDPDPSRVLAKVPPPGQTVAAPPANHVPFGAHDLARKEIRDVRSDGNYFTDEFVADDHRDGDGALRPGIPVVDVEVGAAYA